MNSSICGGTSYVIVYADYKHRYLETNELNNMWAIPVSLTCYEDMFDMIDLSFLIKQETYFAAPGTIQFSFSVKNMLSDSIARDPSRPTMILKVRLSKEGHTNGVFFNVN